MEKNINEDQIVRDEAVRLLSGRGAHVDFDAAVEDFPVELAGKEVGGLAHTAWMLVYHLWTAQHDILEFIRDPQWKSPDYPHGYWPELKAPAGKTGWDEKIYAFRRDLEAMQALVADQRTDLYEKIPHGSGQTILREALVLADHNAYHVAQLIDLRMILGVPVKDW